MTKESENKRSFRQVLLISGSGRNCGKTTLSCRIIKEIAKENEVIGLKITPHFHEVSDRQVPVASTEGFSIYSETDDSSDKDTSRMLQSGASSVYLIHAREKVLPLTYAYLKELLPADIPVVCESGSFAHVYQPGLHLLVKGSHGDLTKPSYFANMNRANMLIDQQEIFDNGSSLMVNYDNGQWICKKLRNDTARKSA
jgi:hypothetical protein